MRELAMTEVDYDATVAVIGMAGRFPGAGSVDAFWDNLLTGRLGLRELGDEELAAAGVSPAQLANPAYVRVSGSIDGYEMFDAGLFGCSRREAELMEPQHRIFLECCFEALEQAGYPPMQMPGRVGVFAGCGYPDYVMNILGTVFEAGGTLMLAIGTERDSLASLASYKLDLRGPSVTVQTFCSTSLVSVHLAAQSLLNFECEVALAGGAFIPLPQHVGYVYEEGGILAPDGRVRAFDAGARGSVVGSGVSVVALKRLPDALADGDHISAVLLGSAVNNDGRACAGYTAPGVDGQAEVIGEAMDFAGVPPETVGYVECHGTGTMLGDSVEIAAMAKVFSPVAGRKVVLASLKPSIGHLDRASGTTGLIRAALALQHRVLPGTPNYETPNPALAAERDTFTVLTENQPWPEGTTPRRAGVSSFGLGGTNAHVVLEEPPPPPEVAQRPGPHLLTLSARDVTALDQATEELREHLGRRPDLLLADVAYTLQQSRSHFPVRRAVICDDPADARAALGDPGRWLTGTAQYRNPLVRIVLPDPAAAGDEWWHELRGAVSRAIGCDSSPGNEQPVQAAAAAVVDGLARIGVRVGEVTGPGSGAENAGPLAAESGTAAAGECQAELSLDPAGAASAANWLATAIARLWQAGALVEWSALHPGDARRVPLPTYPFQRRRYWVDLPANPFQAGSAPGTARTADLTRWTHVPVWQQQPAAIADRSEQIRHAGPWLVLAADERGDAIAAYLAHAGAAVTTVRPGPGFAACSGGDFEVRPDSAEDMGRLLGELDVLPPTIIHAFSLGADGSLGRSEPGQGAAQTRIAGFYSALALVSAYTRQAPDQAVSLVAVTSGAVSVAGTPLRHPDQAALAGLVPVLAQENPGWLCRHVDVDQAVAERGTAALAAAVVAEAVSPHAGPVALRGIGRWVRAYPQLPLPAPAGPNGGLPEGATVLITGGLGHVGLILARHLAVSRNCHVVLTSRTALPPRAEWEQHAAGPPSRMARNIAGLLDLERLGADVIAVTADVADAEQMRAAVDIAVKRFGGIDLVVHGAGISDPSGFGPAHMVSRAGSESHFAAKVRGLQTLREVLAGRDVRGITLSSLSAVLGGLALGPYAAANAVLDAHVVAARAADGGSWITVDWDTWRQELTAPAHNAEFDMAPEEAVEVFDRALAAVDHVDHLVISTGSLAARFDQWVVKQGLGSDGGDEADVEVDPRPELSTPYVEPAEGVEAELARIWSRVLRLDKVGADDDFFGLGGSSVMAIELIARIRKQLRIPVPTSAVMGYPTVRGLAAQIADVTGDMDTAGTVSG
jgi:acyl transferase domain-containing protein/acyl carrier protein